MILGHDPVAQPDARRMLLLEVEMTVSRQC